MYSTPSSFFGRFAHFSKYASSFISAINGASMCMWSGSRREFPVFRIWSDQVSVRSFELQVPSLLALRHKSDLAFIQAS